MSDPRVEVLREAEGYVTKDRNSSYGEPEDNFKAIADIWNAQGVKLYDPGHKVHREVTSTDVALMMMGMKLARLKHNPSHRDSWVDTIGYGACGWQTVAKAQPEDKADTPMCCRLGFLTYSKNHDETCVKEEIKIVPRVQATDASSGYRSFTHAERLAADVSAVQRAAHRDTAMRDASQGPVVTRPIRDNPQA